MKYVNEFIRCSVLILLLMCSNTIMSQNNAWYQESFRVPDLELRKMVDCTFVYGVDKDADTLTYMLFTPRYLPSDLNIKNLKLHIKGEGMPVVRQYGIEVNEKLMKEYLRFGDIAHRNNVEFYSKYIDSLFSVTPIFQGSFLKGDKAYIIKEARTRNMLNRTWGEYGGIEFYMEFYDVIGKSEEPVGVKENGDKVYDYITIPRIYLRFEDDLMLKKYIKAFNLDEALKSYHQTVDENKRRDELFR